MGEYRGCHTLLFACDFLFLLGVQVFFVCVLGSSPPSLPVLCFTRFCAHVLSVLVLFSYYIFLRTRQYKQTGFTTVSIWMIVWICVFSYIDDSLDLCFLLYHSILYSTAFISSPIYSILCLRCYPLYISGVINIFYVIGLRAQEAHLFVMVSS